MARARGSYPRCHWFKSSCRYQQKTDFFRFHIDKRPGGQAVKTPPFHGGNTGSSPVRVTTFFRRLYGGIAQPVERPPHTRKVTDSSSVVSTKTKSSCFRNCFLFWVLLPLVAPPSGNCNARGAAKPPLRNSSLRSEFTAHTRRRPEGWYKIVRRTIPSNGSGTHSSSAISTQKERHAL